MTLTNTQTATLIEAIKSAGKVDNAQVAFAKRVDAMREAGFKAEWLETKSDQIELIRKVVAETALNAKDQAIWSDTSLAVKVKVAGSDKRIDTPRGKLVKLVDQRVARLRKAMSEAPKTGAKQPSNARKLADRIKDEIAKLKNATVKDRDGEPTLACDHKELIAAFDRITDLVVEH